MSEVESHDAETRRKCEVLESVSHRFAPDSEEALAIKDAALAFIVVRQHTILRQAYEKLRLGLGGVLSEEMKNDLRRHGIDPDALGLDDEDLG